MKKEKMLEENDTRRERDFSAKVNSNADKKLKKRRSLKGKRPTPDIPCTSFYLLPFFPIQQKNLEFAMKVKNGVR